MPTQEFAPAQIPSPSTASPSTVAPTRPNSAVREAVRQCLAEMQSVPTACRRRSELREQLVALNTPLVKYLARRFARSGEPADDVVQVGMIGLLKAIDRFDVERAVEFSTYAVPTILGEIKRYFRDATWVIHVPRSARDLHRPIAVARAQLSQELGRSPTVPDIADRLGVRAEDIIVALAAGQSYNTTSLDSLLNPDDRHSYRNEGIISCVDQGLDDAEIRTDLSPLIANLPRRQRELLTLRFVHDKTQTEIASSLGVSQMQVSRLLGTTLSQLREALTASADRELAGVSA